MPLAIRRIDVAGRDVTDALQTHLRRAGYNLHTSAEKEVVRMIKEKCCYIAMNPQRKRRRPRRLGAERFRATEILFNPELHGLEYPGMPQIIVDSINRADLDMRKELFQSIVLSGGTTLTKEDYNEDPDIIHKKYCSAEQHAGSLLAHPPVPRRHSDPPRLRRLSSAAASASAFGSSDCTCTLVYPRQARH
ncbi:hypothetical protein L7F22_016749 [Adiantum nelumboides]|nr:hypothetical protein [Adiantum nelumboides]